MCNKACFDFASRAITSDDVEGKRVLEVGALDVNGSLRQMLQKHQPHEFIGVDIASGPGVDKVCDAGDLASTFGAESFDVVVSTEMIEHVRDWKVVVANLKQVMKVGGTLLVTTRSKGFHYHAYPHDYWRYEIADFREIFSDLSIEYLEADPSMPGVFLKARKPLDFRINDLRAHRLFSMLTGTRLKYVSDWDEYLFRARFHLRRKCARVVPEELRRRLQASRWVKAIADIISPT